MSQLYAHMNAAGVPYCPPGTVQQDADSLDQYAGERAKQQKTFSGPLYDYINLLGFVDGTGLLATGQEFTFFQTPVGQVGGGWTAQQRDRTTTNFEGQSMFPAGVAYVAHAVGFDIGQITQQNAEAIGRHIVRFGWVQQQKYSNIWPMGALRLWPEASFGYMSGAAATAVPGQQLIFPQNGKLMAQGLPRGSELRFTALDQIIFSLRITQNVFLTANGLALNGIPFGNPGSNALDPNLGVMVGVILHGTKFEQSAN